MAAVAEEEGSTVVVVEDTCYGSLFDVLGFFDGILGLSGLSKEVQRAAYLERAQRGDVCLRPMMRLDEGGNAPPSLLGFAWVCCDLVWCICISLDFSLGDADLCCEFVLRLTWTDSF